MDKLIYFIRKSTVLVFIFLYLPLFAEKESLPIYLTWQHEPSTTMTIQWLSLPTATDGQIEYSKMTEQQEKNAQWLIAKGTCKSLPLEAPYNINVIELRDLDPNCKYRFKIKNDENEHYFRTAPKDLSEPFHFAAGGDAYQDEFQAFEDMTKQVALHNPRFALIGGDLAYATEKSTDDFSRWFTFISVISKELKDTSGCKIPLITAIGNHEVMSRRFAQGEARAPFFFSLFAMPGPPGYNVLRFNDYLSLIILDSNHINPVAGEQTEWLKEQLKSQENILHRFATYHVGAYPSDRPFRHKVSTIIRDNWVPLFERYGIQAVFENHDHTYKRTYPLIDDSYASNGIVYFGDGTWGTTPRIPKEASQTTYLAKTASIRQVLHVELTKTKQIFTAIAINGEIVDQYEQPVKPFSSGIPLNQTEE